MPEENTPDMHTDETNIPELNALIGKPGEAVPTVDAADIKALWKFQQELAAQHPDSGVAIAIGVINHICSPGADARAVSYRAGMLGLLHNLIKPAFAGSEPTESAFKVAARMELKWMGVGVVQNGLPFDVARFFAEVHGESMDGGATTEQRS